MPKILLFKNTRILRGHLKRFNGTQNTRRKFLNLGTLDTESRNLFSRLDFLEAKGASDKTLHPERFLKEYVDLIGRIGRKYNSKLWWATDISSKNRFRSKISFLLQEFLIAVEIIGRNDYDYLIIVNSSWVIADSLNIFLRKSGLKFEYFQFTGWRWGIGEIVAVRFRKIASLLFHALRICWQSSYAKRRLRPLISGKLGKQQPYYVVKTFVYKHSFLADGAYRDVFFGDLPEFLSRSRPLLIYAYIPVPGDFRSCVEKILNCPNQTILPIEAFLSYRDILRSLVELLFARVRIKDEFLFFGYDVSAIIDNELLRTANGISLYQFLHYSSTRRLFQSLPVDIFLLTYENNPWEKMCILAGRKYSPRTTILGYQYTSVPQASANLFISRDESDIMPMPDRILTVGKTPKEIMERYGAYPAGKLRPSCALRFDYIFKSEPCKRMRSGNILVAFEGIFEVHRLANYVIRQLKDKVNYYVRVRPHPVLPLRSFTHKLDCRIEGLKNFQVSVNTPLKEDIEWADVVIYWGSTVALEALSLGKPVIHYQTGSLLSYDSLFECGHLRWPVRDSDSVLNLIDKINSMSDNQFEAEKSKAKVYLEDYYFPITQEALKTFLW